MSTNNPDNHVNVRWRCSICLEYLDKSSSKYPVVLNHCGHSFCSECYYKINICSLCRTVSYMAKPNYALIELLGISIEKHVKPECDIPPKTQLRKAIGLIKAHRIKFIEHAVNTIILRSGENISNNPLALRYEATCPLAINTDPIIINMITNCVCEAVKELYPSGGIRITHTAFNNKLDFEFRILSTFIKPHEAVNVSKTLLLKSLEFIKEKRSEFVKNSIKQALLSLSNSIEEYPLKDSYEAYCVIPEELSDSIRFEIENCMYDLVNDTYNDKVVVTRDTDPVSNKLVFKFDIYGLQSTNMYINIYY